MDFGWIDSEKHFKTYTPNPTQLAFHASRKKYNALIGAFRSGKSLAAAFKGISLSLKYPGNVGLICRRDYTTLADSTMKTVFNLLPETCPLVVSWNKTRHDLLIKAPGSNKPSLVMFRGADDYQQFGSYELGWFWIDQAEQVPEMVFRQLSQRLSMPNVPLCGIVTPNPPGQYHWLYRRFKLKLNPETDFVRHTSTYDNQENLPEGYIEDLESQPEAYKKAFLYGEWSFVAEGDPVYADFKSDIHMAKDTIEVIPETPIIRMIDFGYRFPACGWYQIMPGKDRVHKLAELVGENMTVDNFADQVNKISIERFPPTIFETGGDPAGHQASDKSEQTSVEILAAKGLIANADAFISQSTFIKDGLNLVRRELQVRDDGQPGYLIDPSCQLTEEAYLGGYYLKEGSDEPDRDCHPYIDVADTDRYLFVNYVPIQKPRVESGPHAGLELPRPQWFKHFREKTCPR